MSSSVFSSWTFWMTLAALWMIVVSVAGMMWLVVGEQKQKKQFMNCVNSVAATPQYKQQRITH
jgi:hypothetical protein